MNRRCSKLLVGALLALVGVLAPIESRSLPGLLHELAGADAAHAQSVAVGTGVPDDCPKDSTDTRDWKVDPDDESLCVLSYPACPGHPLLSGEYLTPSIEFPDFCEATVLESAGTTVYTDCTNLVGRVIKNLNTGSEMACRIIEPTRCARQLHRVASNECRRVQRRTWSCPTGTPTNEFNTCYQVPADYSGSHPACVSGAPNMTIVQCEDYVDQDFARNPAAVRCNSFDTGNARSSLLEHTRNKYWCKFETRYLNVDCYGTGVCTSEFALCLKRASTTGGCYAIAGMMRCRSLQADYRAGRITADDVFTQGCMPCVVLPFNEVPPGCPRELSANPAAPTRGAQPRFDAVHRLKRDYPGPGSTSCTDPPRGRLVWESSHHTQSAVVNSPIILNVIDLPNRQRTVERMDFLLRLGFSTLYIPRAISYFEYSDTSTGDPLIRTWPPINTANRYADVSAMMESTLSGECRIDRWPDFRIIVQELWPDNDWLAIEELFGSDSLSWWGSLTPDEQRRLTEVRGRELIDTSMSPAERDAELARRTQELRCNYGSDVWCKWTPGRSGYYRLVAAGAWWMKAYSSGRGWRSDHQRQTINDFLMNEVEPAPGDGSCPSGASRWGRAKDYDCILEDLNDMGYASPEEAGLLPDLSGLLPIPTDPLTGRPTGNEWLYSDAAGANFRCAPRDLRVSCGGTGESFNYTETEPVGILVNEIRVTTVMPVR